MDGSSVGWETIRRYFGNSTIDGNANAWFCFHYQVCAFWKNTELIRAVFDLHS